MTRPLTHLERLEAESIFILRVSAGRAAEPVNVNETLGFGI